MPSKKYASSMHHEKQKGGEVLYVTLPTHCRWRCRYVGGSLLSVARYPTALQI